MRLALRLILCFFIAFSTSSTVFAAPSIREQAIEISKELRDPGCVDQDMDEGLVYELTSILYENAGSLGRQHPSLFAMSRDRFMYSALPIPLHPGAERFYWEKGLLSETHGKME